jgi:phosphopantothenoylcysteine decarboxylase/phosphopantothenate--cysteine ligase
MTPSATKFVTPLSFEVASRNRVHTDAFQDPLSHITLTADADLLIIAPATANMIGKCAHGIADDMLSTSFLSFSGKVILAPAMNWRMFEHPVVRQNLQSLVSKGVLQIGPGKGSLACGEDAVGRMSDVQDIVEEIRAALSPKDFAGKKVMVTAGPTREYVDPVRFLSNRSSGKMGYAVARAALRRGADVILISGPSHLPAPSHADLVRVETASEMSNAVLKNLRGVRVVIMAAAVSDFSPDARSEKKIDKSRGLALKLTRTADILSEIGAMKKRPFLVGFAAETGADISRARKKLAGKRADVIVFNDVTSPGSGFDVDTNRVTLIGKGGESSFPLMSKDEVADILLDRIAHFIP